MAKKTYSREFKLNFVQTVEAGELRPAQACREYQIAESVLTRWRQEVRLRGVEAAFTPLRLYGSGSHMVVLRLLEAITNVAGCTRTTEQRQALLRHAEMIYEQVLEHGTVPADRAAIDAQYAAARSVLIIPAR